MTFNIYLWFNFNSPLIYYYYYYYHSMKTPGHFMNKICKFYVYMYVSFYGDFQVSEGNIDPATSNCVKSHTVFLTSQE